RAERRTDINYHSLYDTNEEYPQKGTKWTKAVSLLCLFAAISYSGGGPELSTLKNKVESVMSDKHELTRKRVTAETMAAKQRDISVSEFFAKNRHLLGFDNPRKALLTAVKEAVDNSLDACEEAGIVPEIWVHIEATGANRFKVGVQDNGPGIVKKQI